jgi:hypothetical protein
MNKINCGGSKMYKKYNKIVGSFKKTIKKLEDLNKSCGEKSQSMYQKIASLETERANVINEGDMAQTTADKLKQIFG